MKKKISAAVISMLLLSALSGILLSNVATANFIPNPDDIAVTIKVASPISDKIYNSVILQFTVDMYLENNPGWFRNILSLSNH